MKKNLIVVLLSISVSLFVVELILEKTLHNQNKKHNSYNRYELYSDGGVLEKKEGIFKYYPNKKILLKTYYSNGNKFIKEYDYTIQTNNFGLVQNNEIKKNKDSILFLGDSYTEGHGASSWIDKFKGVYDGLQVINGGIMGTGFNEFELMENHIEHNFKIKKIVLLFIGDDLRRKKFNIHNNTLLCLKDYQNCNGSENFFGYDEKSKNINEYLNFLEENRLKYLKEINKDSGHYLQVTKNFLKDFNIIYYPYLISKYSFLNLKYKNVEKKNFRSIKKLINKYNQNILFIHLNTKEEIKYGKSILSTKVQNYLKKNKKDYFYCNFNNDLNLFYKNDGHPNQIGYDYLFRCVSDILDKN